MAGRALCSHLRYTVVSDLGSDSGRKRSPQPGTLSPGTSVAGQVAI